MATLIVIGLLGYLGYLAGAFVWQIVKVKAGMIESPITLWKWLRTKLAS